MPWQQFSLVLLFIIDVVVVVVVYVIVNSFALDYILLVFGENIFDHPHIMGVRLLLATLSISMVVLVMESGGDADAIAWMAEYVHKWPKA